MNIQEMSDEKLIELCINKNLYDIWHVTWETECGHSCAIHMAAHELSNRINKLKDDNKRLLNLLNRYIPLAEITKNDIQWVLEELKDNNRKE